VAKYIELSQLKSQEE